MINGDICADLPLVEMLQFHREHVGEKGFTILGIEVSRSYFKYKKKAELFEFILLIHGPCVDLA